MSNLSALINRLDHLDRTLAPEQGVKVDDDADLDEFQRTKKNCARLVSEIRKTISERDELLTKQHGSGTRQTIEMSAKVRSSIKKLKDQAEFLTNMQRQEAARASKPTSMLNRKGGISAEEVEHRGEVVDLVFKHIEEVELLEKRRLHGNAPVAEDRIGLLGAAGRSSYAVPRSAQETDLGDIDEDTKSGLAMLQRKDEELDEDLDQISAGVKRLGNLAIDMHSEIQMQNVMIGEIEDRVDRNVAHLQNINAKVKDALEQAGGITRFIVNLVLLILVIAVLLYAARMVMNS